MPRAPRIRTRPTRLPLLHLLPNLVTIGAICAGLTAIRFAMHERFELSVALIVLAAVLDGLDGPLARLLKSESAIGAELDSLADFVNFGVAPSLFLYIWALDDARSLGWIAVLIYAVCTVLRLARFNVSAREPDSGLGDMPPPRKKGFVGVPSPGGALLAMTPFAAAQNLPSLGLPPQFVALWLVVVGFLMISRLPTPSFKSVRIERESVRFLMVGLVAFIAFAATWPWVVLMIVQVGYVVLVALTAWRHGKKEMSHGN